MNERARAAVHGWEQAVNAAWDRLQATMKPTPPSHEELMRRYQVDDDKVGDVNAFVLVGPTVAARERDLLHGLLPWEQADYLHVTLDSTLQARGVFPDDGGREGVDLNHRDAFRHAYWSSQLVGVLGHEQAQELTTVHETRTDPNHLDAEREAMDLYNNEVGRQLAQEHPDATPGEMSHLVQQAVREGRMVVVDDTGRLVPSDYDFKPG